MYRIVAMLYRYLEIQYSVVTDHVKVKAGGFVAK